MKTTLDLPSDLVRELKLRAVHEGRKIKDIVASLLAAGLAASASKEKPMKGHITFPLFPSGPDAPAKHMTIDELIAADFATQTEEDLERCAHSL